MANKYIWTKAEDFFILEEIQRQQQKDDHEIALYLLDHPLYKGRREFGGMYKHVEYLRKGGTVATV